MNPIKVCLVGVGSRGLKHLDRLMALDKFKVVGVADKSLSATGDATVAAIDSECFPTYLDYAEMFEKVEAEAVFISTPHHTHAPICEAALARGLRVFCEKPAAPTKEECLRMLRAEEKYGLPVAVGYHHMGHTNAQWMKNVGLDFLGNLESVVVTIPLNRRDGYYEESDWLGRMKVDGKWCLDGVLMNQGIHYINQAVWFVGRHILPGTMRSFMYKIRETPCLETGDLVVFRCGLIGGLNMFCVATTALEKSRAPTIKLMGDGGIGWYYDNMSMIRLNNGEHIVHNRPDEPDYLYHNFFDFVRNGEEPLCPLGYASWSVEVVEEAFKAVDYQIKDVSVDDGFDLLDLVHMSTDRQCMFKELPNAPDWV